MRPKQLAVLLLASAIVGCAAAPRGRPMKMGPTDTGPGSLEATRRQLEGRWELVSLETYPEPGKAVPIKASGTLTYDAYGNVKTEGTMDDPDSHARSVLSYSGAIVIDVEKKEWRLTGMQTGRGATPALGTEQIRRYELTGDRLTTSTIDDNGRVTARAIWKKTG
jgi:hypothetical protein